jgi:hypothetical protein
MINWSQLCTQQRNLPLWQKQQANYGGCIFAVSALPCPAFATIAPIKLLLIPFP